MNNSNLKKKDLMRFLKNLRHEDLIEIRLLHKKNWKKRILSELKSENILSVKVKSQNGRNIIIAIGGFSEVSHNDDEIACVWLLTSKEVYSHKIFFLKEIIRHLSAAQSKYKIIYNRIYKSNFESKFWLKKLGFCFDNPFPKGLNIKNDFEFFYKIGGVS